jgi:hypothetical protein
MQWLLNFYRWGGQWFRYTMNVASTGRYTVSLRVAPPSAVAGAHDPRR